MNGPPSPEDVLRTRGGSTRRSSTPVGGRQKCERSPLHLLTPADCAASPPRGYVIKGLIAPGDLALVFGQPGAGKSVVAPHLGYAVAQGRAVFGRRVRRGTVFYVAAEDPHGMRQRVHALRLEHGDAPDFLVVEGIAGLFADGDDFAELFGLVQARKPVLVIVDTLAAAFPGLRENEAEDMARVLETARRLTRTGCAVMLLHHAPKGDDSTPRGHGSLYGDADVALRLAPEPEGGPVWAKLGKNRNGQSGSFAGFTIRAVRTGTDVDGDAITAPVADELDGGESKGVQLTRAEATARRFLADLIVGEGKPLPVGSDWPDGLRGVAEVAWRASCESRRLSTAAKAEDRERTFRRAYSGLLDKAAVAARDGLVWITKPDDGGLS